MLLVVVALARSLGLDAESALRRATSKLAARADRTLALAEERGLDLATMTDDERERLYQEARGSTG